MIFILSKGLVYKKNEDNTLSIWHNNKIENLTLNESIIWNLFSWEPKNKECVNKYNISAVEYVINSLLEKKLIYVSPDTDENSAKFFCVASNRIKLLNIKTKDKIKSGNIKRILRDIKTKYDLTLEDEIVYNYLKDYDGQMSISDIVLAIDNKLFQINYLTDGYTYEYIKEALRSESSIKTTNSVIKLLKARLIFIN